LGLPTESLPNPNAWQRKLLIPLASPKAIIRDGFVVLAPKKIAFLQVNGWL
jgi:hypothetical protein